jgi:MscS family membrane protein
MPNPFLPLWRDFAAHHHPLSDILAFAARPALLVLVWVLALALRRTMQWLLARLLNLLAKHGPATRQLDWQAIEAHIAGVVTLPGNILLAAFALHVSAALLNTTPLAPYLARLANTLICIGVAIFLGQFVNQLVLSANRRLSLFGITLEQPLVPFAHTFVWLVISFFVLDLTLEGWGFNATALIASTGLLTLAFSLAAKDTAENLLGYFVIVLERPFLIGDVIKTGDISGTVEHVGWRSTKIRQLDQVLVSVPNRNLTAANIANSQRKAKQMLECTLHLAYGTSAEQIDALVTELRGLLQARPLIERDSVVVLLLQLGKDALEVLVRCHILDPDWKTFQLEQEAILLQMLQTLERLEIELALPGQKVRIHPVGPVASLMSAAAVVEAE